jgi:hypothetical protein
MDAVVAVAEVAARRFCEAILLLECNGPQCLFPSGDLDDAIATSG